MWRGLMALKLPCRTIQAAELRTPKLSGFSGRLCFSFSERSNCHEIDRSE